MKNFLKDLVSNQTLLITAFFSATTLLLSLMQFFRDILNNRRQNQLEKTKLNYTYKLNCYSELIAIFAEKSSSISDGKISLLQFRSLVSKARLLADEETKQKITRALDSYISSNEEKFLEDFQELLFAMENELKTENKKHRRVWKVLIAVICVAIISSLYRTLGLILK